LASLCATGTSKDPVGDSRSSACHKNRRCTDSRGVATIGVRTRAMLTIRWVRRFVPGPEWPAKPHRDVNMTVHARNSLVEHKVRWYEVIQRNSCDSARLAHCLSQPSSTSCRRNCGFGQPLPLPCLRSWMINFKNAKPVLPGIRYRRVTKLEGVEISRECSRRHLRRRTGCHRSQL
jgi:hypothetical protein